MCINIPQLHPRGRTAKKYKRLVHETICTKFEQRYQWGSHIFEGGFATYRARANRSTEKDVATVLFTAWEFWAWLWIYITKSFNFSNPTILAFQMSGLEEIFETPHICLAASALLHGQVSSSHFWPSVYQSILTCRDSDGGPAACRAWKGKAWTMRSKSWQQTSHAWHLPTPRFWHFPTLSDTLQLTLGDTFRHFLTLFRLSNSMD